MDIRVQDDGTTSGGADGCVDYEDPDNKGLMECIVKFGYIRVYQNHCGRVSLADYLIIAAEAVMGRASPLYNEANPFAPGTLHRKFRD